MELLVSNQIPLSFNKIAGSVRLRRENDLSRVLTQFNFGAGDVVLSQMADIWYDFHYVVFKTFKDKLHGLGRIHCARTLDLTKLSFSLRNRVQKA